MITHIRICSAGAMVALLTVCPAAWSQAPAADKGLPFIREVVRARETTTSPVLYIRVEKEISGPARCFPLPAGLSGSEYRQVNYQEWWVRDQQITVAESNRSECWLDGTLIQSKPDTGIPRYTISFDGVRAYYRDTREEGQFLQINAAWPYAGAAIPAFFGRAFSSIRFAEILDRPDAAVVGVEETGGKSASVIEWREGRNTVRAWLDEETDFLCSKVQVRGPRGLILERRHTLAQNQQGVWYPAESTEQFMRPDGAECSTVWRTLEFAVYESVPDTIFSPSYDEADIVTDRLTGEILKQP